MDLPPPNLSANDEPRFAPQPRPVQPTVPVQPLQPVDVETDKALIQEDLEHGLSDALAFPLRDAGWMVVLLASVPNFLLGGVGILSLLWLGYWATYLVTITESTATGRKTMPYMPDLTDGWQEIAPLVVVIFIGQVLPFHIIAAFISAEGSGLPAFLTGLALWLLLDAYAVVSVLRFIKIGSVSSVLPFGIVRSCLSIGQPLLKLLGWRMVLLVGFVFGADLIYLLPYIGWFLPVVLYTYLQLAQARMLGTFYRAVEHRLPW
jgi:hypothetical protein